MVCKITKILPGMRPNLYFNYVSNYGCFLSYETHHIYWYTFEYLILFMMDSLS